MSSYVPKYQMSAITARRKAESRKRREERGDFAGAYLQYLCKNGKWSKPMYWENIYYGVEDADGLVKKAEEMNSNKVFRIAQM